MDRETKDDAEIDPTESQADVGYFKHPQALVESEHIGPRTRIWAFAHVLPGAVIGADCNICDHVFIENDVRIGDGVTVKSGVQLWDGVVLEDGVFVGPNATFTNDPFPRSKKPPAEFSRTTIKSGASIGANATILSGITIGRAAMVGAGAVVTRDVPANALVVGNPARIKEYVEPGRRVESRSKLGDLETEAISQPATNGVTLHKLTVAMDLWGSPEGTELGELPFRPQRLFVVRGQKPCPARAHRSLHQFLICLKGDCSLLVDDGQHREDIMLDNSLIGVHLSPLVWADIYRMSSDAMLLVLSSEHYDPAGHISNYDDYVRAIKTK